MVLDCAESIMEALDNDGDGEITKVFENIVNFDLISHF